MVVCEQAPSTPLHRYVNRFMPLRVHPDTRRHTAEDLEKIGAIIFPGILVDDDNYVVAGFALAQALNQLWLGRRLRLHRYSPANEAFIRDFIRWIDDLADRHHWSAEMRKIELQVIGKHKFA